jgi:hypothetical protein
MNWNELESMTQICTRHILFACVLKRNGKKKKLTHFVFRFVIWERFVVDYYCLGLSIHILSTIDDIFVKNQKESKRMRKVSWNWKMKVWLVSFVDWLIEKQQTNNEYWIRIFVSFERYHSINQKRNKCLKKKKKHTSSFTSYSWFNHFIWILCSTHTHTHSLSLSLSLSRFGIRILICFIQFLFIHSL